MPGRLAHADGGNGVTLCWPWIGTARLETDATATMLAIRVSSVLTVVNLDNE
jgi:hypothetical protein